MPYIPKMIGFAAGVILSVCFVTEVMSFGGEYAVQPMDSVTTASPRLKVKRYIRPSFYYDFYGPGASTISRMVTEKNVRGNTVNELKNLANYSFKLQTMGFYLPIYTHTWEKNETKRPSLQVLFTGNLLYATNTIDRSDYEPNASPSALNGVFYKISAGVRLFYNDGGKNTLFLNFTPFISQDQNTTNTPNLLYWGAFVYNRTVNPSFSYRIGYIKTYLLSNVGYHLPYLGVRFGRLDKTNLSIQIPRNISLNFPVIRGKLYGTVFTKALGGIFNYNNSDSSLAKFYDATGYQSRLSKQLSGDVLQFRFYELMTGIGLDYRINHNINVYMNVGISGNRQFDYAKSNTSNALAKTNALLDFSVKSSGFINFGFAISFGKARSVNNNYAMYDVFDINNAFDPGDNNLGKTNSDIPAAQKDDLQNLTKSYREIRDLVYDVE